MMNQTLTLAVTPNMCVANEHASWPHLQESRLPQTQLSRLEQRTNVPIMVLETHILFQTF